MAFDFGISSSGDLLIDNETGDILTLEDIPLKIQLAYNRIKSVSKDWFIDECGADLEEIIGKPMTDEWITSGNIKIRDVLTSNDLWTEDQFIIYSQIKDDNQIEYTIIFKIEEGLNVTPYEMVVNIDLVKGINIRYGWNPRRELW